MEKTIHFALFLFLVTGLLFVGCSSEEVPEETQTGGSLEESLEVADEEDEETPEEETSAEETSEEEDVEEEREVVEEEDTQSEEVIETESGESESDESAYEDGTYTQTGSYTSPGGTDSIGVTLVVEGGVVKSVSISDQSSNEVSAGYVKLFSEGISSVVVGKPIESISNVSAVNGASLTPNGFNKAVQAILKDAQN